MAQGLCCPAAGEIFPDKESKTVSPALAGGSYPLYHQRGPENFKLLKMNTHDLIKVRVQHCQKDWIRSEKSVV